MADRYEYSDKARTPLFRGAFVRVIEPEDVKNQDGTTSKVWGLTAIWPKGTDMAPVKNAITQAAKKLWGDKAGTMLQHAKFKNPLKDGAAQVDREGNLYAGFEAGQTTAKLSTKLRRPGLVDRQVRQIADADGKTLVDKDLDLYETVEANAIFSGCWFFATFSAQAYDRSDGFGVSLKLENLQLVKQDERLGGSGASRPEDDFGVIDSGASDDLADLLG